MTAYEMIDGEWYEQGTDEFYAALEDSQKVTPSVDLARFLAKWFHREAKIHPRQLADKLIFAMGEVHDLYSGDSQE